MFENKSEATAPARLVAITDTLDPNLDLNTFELFEIAFANFTLAVPPGLDHYETRIALIGSNSLPVCPEVQGLPTVRNFAAQAGRVVVVGQEPLLEAFIETNRQPSLVLYALPGTTNTLYSTQTPHDTNSWTFHRQVTVTNLFQVIQPICTNNCSIFFRARREVGER